MAQKINLNIASKDELDRIPGMGQECAQAILDYRAQHGQIRSIEEMDNVPGVGKKALEHLRDNATV